MLYGSNTHTHTHYIHFMVYNDRGVSLGTYGLLSDMSTIIHTTQVNPGAIYSKVMWKCRKLFNFNWFRNGCESIVFQIFNEFHISSVLALEY